MDLATLGGNPTGRERTLQQLRTVDERSHNIGRSGLTVRKLQAPLLRAMDDLPPDVPAEVQKRLTTSISLICYGWFCWELNVVAISWSLGAVEMALLLRLLQTLPQPIVLRRQQEAKEFVGSPSELYDAMSDRWKLDRYRSGSLGLRGLLQWAADSRLLTEDLEICSDLVVGAYGRSKYRGLARKGRKPRGLEDLRATSRLDVLLQGLPELRNSLAHPESEWTHGPGQAQMAFLQAVEVIRKLRWGEQI